MCLIQINTDNIVLLKNINEDRTNELKIKGDSDNYEL